MPTAREDPGAQFKLVVMPETFIEPASTAKFQLSVNETGSGTRVDIRVEDAIALKAAYLELHFDAQHFSYAECRTGPALNSAVSHSEVLALAISAERGIVDIGQVLPNWDKHTGFHGTGLVASIYFNNTPAAVARTVCAPPISVGSAPLLEFDGPTAKLSWRYANQGDYNQDGFVWCTDLTQLGIHYGETVTAADANTAKAMVDGNGDGLINIGDLAVIGMYFKRDALGGWAAYQSNDIADYPGSYDDDNGAATLQTGILFSDYDSSTSPSVDRLLFTLTLPSPVNGQYVWLRVLDDMSRQGIASNAVVLSNVNLPPIAGITADTHEGPPSLQVHFSAISSGDPDGTIECWRWDPEGDGTYLMEMPGSPGSSELDYAYNTPGIYSPTVKVWDNLGASDTVSTYVVTGYGTPEPQLVDDGNGTNNVGKYPSLKLIDGTPSIAYMDVTAQTVKYVQAFTSAGIGWGWPVTIGAGANLSCELAEINGHPAVVYEGSSNNIAYIRALDTEGYDWSGPAVNAISGAATSLYFACLKCIEGRPAIAYCDAELFWSGNVYYCRAADSTGASWGVPYMLNAEVFSTSIPSLSVVNGAPAIAYTLVDGVASWGLAYTHGEDTTGGSWSADRGIALGNEVYISKTGMAQVVGRPAIAFWDNGDGMLKYVRANDAEGSEWGEIINIAASSHTMASSSLAVVNNLPAIAYADSDSGLMYVQAMSKTGSMWNEPVVLDEIGGMHPSLIEINKRAGVAHYDLNNGQLRFTLFR